MRERRGKIAELFPRPAQPQRQSCSAHLLSIRLEQHDLLRHAVAVRVGSGAPRGCAGLGTYPLVMRIRRACVCTQCPVGIGSAPARHTPVLYLEGLTGT